MTGNSNQDEPAKDEPTKLALAVLCVLRRGRHFLSNEEISEALTRSGDPASPEHVNIGLKELQARNEATYSALLNAWRAL